MNLTQFPCFVFLATGKMKDLSIFGRNGPFAAVIGSHFLHAFG